jgi:hypothetical protein
MAAHASGSLAHALGSIAASTQRASGQNVSVCSNVVCWEALTVKASAHPEPCGVEGEVLAGVEQWHVDNPALCDAVRPAVLDGGRPDGPHRELLLDKCGGKVLCEEAATRPVTAPQAQIAVPKALGLALHAALDLVAKVDRRLCKPDLARLHSHCEFAPVARGCALRVQACSRRRRRHPWRTMEDRVFKRLVCGRAVCGAVLEWCVTYVSYANPMVSSCIDPGWYSV